MKGISPLIGFVLTIFLITVAVAVALSVVKPTIDRSKAYMIYSESIQNLQLLDSAIREVASEAEGSKRTVLLTVTDGEYRINTSKELIYFRYTPPVDLNLGGRAGNFWIERGFAVGDWFNNYVEGSNASDNWQIISGNWSVTSSMYRGENGTAYFSVGKQLDGFSVSADIQTESGKGEVWVEPVDPSSLVGYWSFDEGSGTTAYDWSGHGNNGTLYNGSAVCAGGNCPNWVDGKFDKALSFDGVDDYVDTPLLQNQVTEYTEEAWIKATSGATGDLIIIYDRGITATNGKSLTLYLSSAGHFGATDGSLCFGVDSEKIWVGVYSPGYNLKDGKWHHIVGVFKSTAGQPVSPSNFKLYIDGKDAGATATPTQIGSVTSPVTGYEHTLIGRSVAWDQWFNGIIDEVRIYNRALSDEEIKALYELGLKKLESSGKITTSQRISPYIVFSNPFGRSYFDDLRVDANKDTTIYVIMPYSNVNLEGSFIVGKGNYQVLVENKGIDSNGKPIVNLSVLS